MKAFLWAVFFAGCINIVKAQQFKIILEEPGVENAYPRLSKDGKTILYQSDRSGKWQLYILDMATGKSRQLTRGEHNNNFPDWNARNEWITFVSDRDGNEEIYMMKADGSALQRLTQNPERDIHPYFSPDSKYILFNSTRDGKSLDIYRLHLTSKKIERLTNTPQHETCARYSNDMKFIVFLKNDDTSDDVFMMDMARGLTTNITHTPDIRDGWPMLSADGKWVYFSSLEKGLFNIYRIKPDGSNKEQLTDAGMGEEDARAFISANGKTLIYNKRKNDLIAIVETEVQ